LSRDKGRLRRFGISAIMLYHVLDLSVGSTTFVSCIYCLRFIMRTEALIDYFTTRAPLLRTLSSSIFCQCCCFHKRCAYQIASITACSSLRTSSRVLYAASLTIIMSTGISFFSKGRIHIYLECLRFRLLMPITGALILSAIQAPGGHAPQRERHPDFLERWRYSSACFSSRMLQ